MDSRQNMSSLMGPPGYPHLPPMSSTAPSLTGDCSDTLRTGSTDESRRCTGLLITRLIQKGFVIEHDNKVILLPWHFSGVFVIIRLYNSRAVQDPFNNVAQYPGGCVFSEIYVRWLMGHQKNR